MTRRRLVALASAAVIVGTVVIAALLVVSLTQTAFGRERVRDFLLTRIVSAMGDRGTMYVGRMEGGLFTGVTIDSFAIRDADDSVFVSATRVHVSYDPRDLLDRRLLIRRLEIEQPVVNLRRHADGRWNFQRIFPRGEPTGPRRERGFGDFILVRDAIIREGTFILTEPWSPNDSLVGARRDSAIAHALADNDSEIRQTAEGLKRTLRWTNIELRSPHVRITHPDSAGQYIVLDRLDTDVSDPPFSFRRVQGAVRILRDTLRFEARRFELPGSEGSATGMVTFPRGQPTRYDIHIRGDRVSLADVNWVYPTLPRTGGGTMKLHIRSAANHRVMEYALSEMDVRTTGSRIRGSMTFAVGEPVLVVKDVDLRADPVNFDFIRALNGGPFPQDWRGDFHGTIVGPGGPLNRWRLGEARFTFTDANVPGAVARGIARGEMDILDPGETVFRGVDLELATFDLRTLEYLFEEFPRLGGTVAGRARLDSLWLDVRFSSADVTHRNGEGIPTRMLGSGRVDFRDEVLAFDVDMRAEPIAFSMLQRSYPGLPLVGTYTGPLRARGTMEDLELVATLTGDPGTVVIDGQFDLVEPYFTGRGRLALRDFDLRSGLERPDLPLTRLTLALSGDVRGSDRSDLAGRFAVEVDQSNINGVRLFPSTGQVAFDAGRLRIDSLRVETSLARVVASGAIGLTAGVERRDSLRYAFEIDSLALLSHLLPRTSSMRARIEAAAAEGAAEEPSDVDEDLEVAPETPLGGSLIIAGVLTGSVDTLRTRGTLDGLRLALGENRAQRLHGTYELSDLTGALHGRLQSSFDLLTLGGVAFDALDAELLLASPDSGAVHFGARGGDGAVRWEGRVDFSRGQDRTGVVASALDLTTEGDRWSLVGPATFTFTDSLRTLDSLVMRNRTGGSIRAAGAIPMEGDISGRLAVSRFPLGTISSIVRELSLGGQLDLQLDLAGTRLDPRLTVSGAIDEGRVGEIRLPYLSGSGRYEHRRLRTTLQFLRGGQTVLTFQGVLPVNLALDGSAGRLLDEPLTGRIRADSVDLGLIEPMTPWLRRVTGVLHTDVSLGGTWARPTFAGNFGILNGEAGVPELGIRLRRITADVDFTRDSVLVRRFSAMSGEQRGDTAALVGVMRLDEGRLSGFDLTLTARNFRAVRSRRYADLDLSGRLRLHGLMEASALDGSLRVDRGVIYIPDRVQKHVVELDGLGEELGALVDTSVVANRHLLPRSRSAMVDALIRGMSVDNLQVAIGDDFWLRSSEANVKLGGNVEILQAGDELALRGALQAARGTYRLDLGLVQRTFQVDSGSIAFYGEPELNPTLDIWASHIVRQANRQGQDVRIHANIGGTLQELRLTLTTDEQLPLSYTEILSYLVFGAPSFAVGQENSGALRLGASALIPTLGGAVERALSEQLGFFDIFQIHAGSVGAAGDEFSLRSGSRVLEGSRIGVGKQLDERTFLSANAGLCAFTRSSEYNFTESLGLTLERRLNYGFSAQLAMEPASAALFCRPGQGAFNTPRQFGFDLFREWSF